MTAPFHLRLEGFSATEFVPLTMPYMTDHGRIRIGHEAYADGHCVLICMSITLGGTKETNFRSPYLARIDPEKTGRDLRPPQRCLCFPGRIFTLHAPRHVAPCSETGGHDPEPNHGPFSTKPSYDHQFSQPPYRVSALEIIVQRGEEQMADSVRGNDW
jgi:hypothetical protein